MIKTSWKTSLAGSLNSLGTMLVGAGVVPGLTDMTYAEKLKPLIIVGFILKATSEFFHGWSARDDDVTSEEVGLVIFPHTTLKETTQIHIDSPKVKGESDTSNS